MNESKYTPGPWHIVGECVMEGSIEIICGDPKAPAYEWEFVASVHYESDKDSQDVNTFTKEMGEANARLIVAACNAAQEINPENPIAAAEAMPELAQAVEVALIYLEDGAPKTAYERLSAAFARIKAGARE